MNVLWVRAILYGALMIHPSEISLHAQPVGAVDGGLQTQAQLAKKIRLERCFLRRIVSLTPAQEERLSAFDIEKFQDLRIQQRKIAPGVDFGADQARVVIGSSTTDPLKVRQVERAFEREIAAVLTSQQHTIYLAEKKLRDDFQIETAVRGVLIILDKRLSLSSAQRQAIFASLMQWGGITSFDIAPYESASQYLPPIPDSVLVDHLNQNQRIVLRATARVDFADHMPSQPSLNGDIEMIR